MIDDRFNVSCEDILQHHTYPTMHPNLHHWNLQQQIISRFSSLTVISPLLLQPSYSLNPVSALKAWLLSYLVLSCISSHEWG